MIKIVVLFNGYSKSLTNNEIDANCTCTLIKADKNVIVDTMTAWDGERLIKGLAEHGLQPNDIDFVVSTHSHTDHIGCNYLFLNAEHIVGHSVQRGTIFYSKRIKDEDYELCDGVRVTATPGHSYEDVTVLVDKGKGSSNSVKYAITALVHSEVCCTGDLFEREEDIADPSLWEEVGTPELREIQASSRLRILRIADYIIPGHGPMFKTNSAQIELVENQIIKKNDS